MAASDRLAVLLLFSAAIMIGADEPSQEQAIIENTGSTNTSGIKIVVNGTGAAEVHPQDAEMRNANVDRALCDRLFADLKSIGSLSALPRAHCIKSVSFGSSLYVEYNGERSPDLNCPVAPGSKLAALQKDARDVMDAAHATPSSRRRVFTVPQK